MKIDEVSIAVYFIIICTLLVIILLFFIGAIFIRYQKRQEDARRKLEEIKINHENELLKTRLQVQENTFQHIAREIHDNIGQKLTLAKLTMNASIDQRRILQEIDLNGITQLISDALNDLRDISRGLNSDLITTNGLLKAVENEINLLHRACPAQIRLQLIGETFYLTADRELILFRIVQEALSNIMKHADASEVSIAIDYSKTSQLSMSIQDNGTGFDIHKVQEGSGLLNIKQRALLLKGFCRIESMKGNGTLIFIQIPVHEAQEFELQSIEEKVQADTKISSL